MYTACWTGSKNHIFIYYADHDPVLRLNAAHSQGDRLADRRYSFPGSNSFFRNFTYPVFILIVNVANEIIKIIRRILVEDIATKTEKKARGLVISSLLKAPLAYFKEHMTGNIHGRLNRCLEGTVKLEKLIFMDFAPAIFNSIAAIVVIFTTLPVKLAVLMLLVVPIGIAIVFRQIHTQKGIRVELLESKAQMDGAIVELLNGIEVIRITDSNALEEKDLQINQNI